MYFVISTSSIHNNHKRKKNNKNNHRNICCRCYNNNNNNHHHHYCFLPLLHKILLVQLFIIMSSLAVRVMARSSSSTRTVAFFVTRSTTTTTTSTHQRYFTQSSWMNHPVMSSTPVVTNSALASASNNNNNNNNIIDGKNNNSSIQKNMMYWNREDSTPRDFSTDAPLVQTAKIVSLSDPNDPANDPLHKGELPEGSSLLAVGTSLEEFDLELLKQEEPNVLFVSHPMSRRPLAGLLQALPSVEWIHTRSAGIDFVTSDELAAASNVHVTNAKGQFSSTLAEYTMMACSYFAKDLPRLLKNKNAKNWEKYSVLELRGTTMGIVGYGDIGRAAAKLAQIYGMKIVALRRNPAKAQHDPYCDVVYGNDKESLNRLFAESDYILCSAPLTPETQGMIGKEQFDCAKKGAVFINLGRGPIVDEDALIDALKDGRLKGAGLDVFATEPLPTSSDLWELDNVLLSPHNMDQTDTFMHEATEFFVQENLPRFLRGEELLNPVDKVAGY